MRRKRITDSKQKKLFQKIVKAAIKEDLGRGDITTDSIVGESEKALGLILPKQDGVLCGINIAEEVFRQIDDTTKITVEIQDGETFSPGMTIATVIGSASSCLKAERTALNFLQRLSGIATFTRRFVEVANGRIKILDTRKTLPGLRVMEKYAVRTGGGHNHRFGLYDMVLIKDNHIEIAGSIHDAVNAVRQNRKKTFIEVEVQTFEQLREVLSENVDRVMLDNMTVADITQAVGIVRQSGKNVELEVSGGIKLHDIERLANTGIDCVSVGALTHSASAIDISMQLKLLGKGES